MSYFQAVLPFMTGISNSSDKIEHSDGGDKPQSVVEVAKSLRDSAGLRTGTNNPACSICLLSSQGGCIGLIGYTAYSTSKFALRGLAESLQMELRPHNVQVTLTHPPDTETPSLVKENQERSALLKLVFN